MVCHFLFCKWKQAAAPRARIPLGHEGSRLKKEGAYVLCIERIKRWSDRLIRKQLQGGNGVTVICPLTDEAEAGYGGNAKVMSTLMQIKLKLHLFCFTSIHTVFHKPKPLLKISFKIVQTFKITCMMQREKVILPLSLLWSLTKNSRSHRCHDWE